MATKVVMEALSPTMEEGRLVEWKKNEGDAVAVGDVLAEVETDKAVMELVARAGGTLLKQSVAAGATVPVSAVVGWIGKPGEPVNGDGKPGAPAGAPAPNAPAQAKPAPTSAPSSAPQSIAPPVEAAPAPTVSGGRVKASPLARRMAAEKGVDLGAIHGTGPEGRVIARDLATASAGAQSTATSPPPSPASPPPSARPAAPAPTAPAVARTSGAPYQDVPLTQIRKTIAKRLAQSIGPIPTFYLTSEIDMERIAEAREALNAAAGDQGKVSFNDIVIKAVALCLRQHPLCNAWWQDDKIRYWNEIHIGMAVAIPDGLITPVLRNTDLMSLREIGTKARELAGRARDRKLAPEEYTGATFSVSNLGMFDIEHFTAVINPPEAGILAVGRIAQVPAVVDGQIAPRRRMRVTMSCDHRVIDGATGAAFLKSLKMMLENPLALVW